MIDNSVSTLSIIHLDNKSGQTIIIVACEDLSVHLLKSQTSQYLFNTGFEVDRIFTYNDYDYLIIAVLLKKNDLPYNVIEESNIQMIFMSIKYFVNDYNYFNIFLIFM